MWGLWGLETGKRDAMPMYMEMNGHMYTCIQTRCEGGRELAKHVCHCKQLLYALF